jgi:hypothetical protein
MSPRIFQRSSPSKTVRNRLLDQAIQRYCDWRQASAGVYEAYGNWLRAPAAEAALSFAAYGAALDREERAAARYSSVIDRLEPVPGGEL